MSTVDKALADNIVRGDGWMNGDRDNSMGDNPRCVLITEYTNAWGSQAYGLTFEGRRNVYTESEYVRSPRTYWEAA